jgi:pyruvate, water dikinase
MAGLDIFWLNELSASDADRVGEKAAYLAELNNKKLPIPNAFVIDAEFCNQIISKFRSQIDELLRSVLDLNSAYAASSKIRELLGDISFTEDVKNILLSHYKKVNDHPDHENMSSLTRQLVTSGRDLPFLAVRPSPTKSFPFQFKSILNVYGSDMLFDAIKKLIISIFSPQAIYFRYKNNIQYSDFSVPIIVQKMVYAVKSGDVFTLNPITNQKTELYFQAIWGINSNLFDNPSSIIFDRQSGVILDSKEIDQEQYYTKNGQFGELLLEPLPQHIAQTSILSENELKVLTNLANRIEQIMNFPQHIEWVIDRSSVQIVQTQPLTRIFKKPLTSTGNGILINSASSSGKAVVIDGNDDLGKVGTDSILITNIANRNIFPYLVQSSGFVCKVNGLTSPAVQFCKDFSIPAVFQAKSFESISDGQEIQFTGSSCDVIQSTSSPQSIEDYAQPVASYSTEVPISDLDNVKEQFEQLERALIEQVSKEAQKRAAGEHTSEADFRKSQLISELEWKVRNLRKKLDELV